MYEAIKDALTALNEPNIIKQINDAALSNSGGTISLGFPIHIDHKDKIHFMLNADTRIQPQSLYNLTTTIEHALGFNDISDEREAVKVHLKIPEMQINYIFHEVILITPENIIAIQKFLRDRYRGVFSSIQVSDKPTEVVTPFWSSDKEEFDPNAVVEYLQKDPKVWNSLKRSPSNCSVAFDTVRKALFEEDLSNSTAPTNSAK
jgi:hypothetical protein